MAWPWLPDFDLIHHVIFNARPIFGVAYISVVNYSDLFRVHMDDTIGVLSLFGEGVYPSSILVL